MSRRRNPIWREDDLIRKAFDGALSMSDIIRNLGQPLGSASFLNLKRAAERLGLTIPVSRPSNLEALRTTNTRPLEEVLVERSSYSNRQSLKKKLIRAGLKEDRCEECGISPEWNGKTLVLQLDHSNGIGDDNRIENLRILCPNCHSQTATFGFRPGIDRSRVG